jgi:hypothetical protein
MEPEGSFSMLSIPPDPTSLGSILIISTHAIHATCPAYLILLNLIVQILLGEE